MGGARQFILRQVVGANLTGDEPPSLTLDERERTIGRSELSELEVNVPTVSRRHATVWMERDTPMVRDLDSAHGTHVNSSQISGPTSLRQGDLVALGADVVFLVSAVEDAEIAALQQAKHENEEQFESPLVELALTNTASSERVRNFARVFTNLPTILTDYDQEDKILTRILEELSSLIPADRFLALTGQDAKEMTVVARKLLRPSETSHWHPPSASILRRGLLSPRAVISFDAQTDSRFRGRRSVTLSNVRSAICVAVRGSRGPLGILYADTFATAGLHNLDDGRFMEVIGRAVGMRLEQLEDGRELRRLRQQLRQSAHSVVEQSVALAEDLAAHLEKTEAFAARAAAAAQDSLSADIREQAQTLRDQMDRYVNWDRVERTRPGSVVVGYDELREDDGDEQGEDTDTHGSIPELPEAPRAGLSAKHSASIPKPEDRPDEVAGEVIDADDRPPPSAVKTMEYFFAEEQENATGPEQALDDDDDDAKAETDVDADAAPASEDSDEPDPQAKT